MSEDPGRHRDHTRAGRTRSQLREQMAMLFGPGQSVGRHAPEVSDLVAEWDEAAAFMGSMARHPAGKGRG